MRAVTLSILFMAAGSALAQRGGGGMPTPDESFNKLLASYQGTGDVIDYARVPPDSRERFNRFASFTGSPPMPLTGTIDRGQYAEAFNQRMDAMKAKGGMGGGGSRGGAPTAPTVTATASVTPGGAPPIPLERIVSDEDVGRTMRKYDSDDDGRISAEEAQRSDRLRPIFAHYDANKDGVMDMAEVKVYANDRENRRGPASDPNLYSGNNGSNGSPSQYGGGGSYSTESPRGDRNSAPANVEEARPVALRYGKLPKEMPPWFEALDTDKDGQVGMYEWRASAEKKKVMNEFLSMDLNSDGLLTAEEYIRFKKVPSANGTASEAATTSDSRSSRGSENGKDKERSSKDDRKESKGNPFRK